MAAFRVMFILLFISNISYVLSKTVSVYPLVGLFGNNTLEETLTQFKLLAPDESKLDSSSLIVCTGRAIYPVVSDIYSVALEVCRNTSDDDAEVIAVLDARPTNGICDTTCLLSNKLHIPNLSIGWGPIDNMIKYPYTFSYYPPPHIASIAYATLIRDLGWQRFSFLYEDDSSFIRLQKIIDLWPPTKFPIVFKQLIPNTDNRETFKYILKTERIDHHVIDCEVDHIVQYMQDVLKVDNSTRYHSFILTNLDAHTVEMTSIPNMVANVSTLFIANNQKLETALTMDALKHLRLSLTQMQLNKLPEAEEDSSENRNPPKLCYESEDNFWIDGENLRDALNQTTAEGRTGRIQFDDKGERVNFTLHYKKLDYKATYIYAGKWNSNTQIFEKIDNVKDRAETESGVITVISKKGLPYFEINTETNKPYGYVVDLVTDIFNIIKTENLTTRKLVFREVKDGRYGNPEEGTGKWDGIMGELMDHTADLGTCDLTITSERSSVVDFSTPFMTTGISMLFKKGDPVEPRMFSFIDPLTIDVWLYLATTYIIVSFIFLICARMSNLDWVNPHPCNRNPEDLENIWSYYNCTWFAMGTIMTQGCDILPRGLGSRWIAGMWWFFAMILTASYTANMSTFLRNSRLDSDIKNAKDLSEQNKVIIGAVINASTYKFFKNSKDPVYAKIWEQMNSARPSVFTSDNEKGMERVLQNKESNFAFFMESSMIKYYTERSCKLKMVGQPFDYKAYGIAMPKNFPQKTNIDTAIIKLQESGRLAELEDRWWKVPKENKNCPKEEEDDGSLQMKNTSGIFLVLGMGGILGVIIAVIDFLLHANRVAVKEKLTFKEAVLSEWHASLNPRTLAKPVAPPRSAPPSTGSPSPHRERSTSRAVSLLRAASTSFINFDTIY